MGRHREAKAISEESAQVQDIAFGKRVVQTFVMKMYMLLNAALLLRLTVQNVGSIGWKS